MFILYINSNADIVGPTCRYRDRFWGRKIDEHACANARQ